MDDGIRRYRGDAVRDLGEEVARAVASLAGVGLGKMVEVFGEVGTLG